MMGEQDRHSGIAIACERLIEGGWITLFVGITFLIPLVGR